MLKLQGFSWLRMGLCGLTMLDSMIGVKYDKGNQSVLPNLTEI